MEAEGQQRLRQRGGDGSPSGGRQVSLSVRTARRFDAGQLARRLTHWNHGSAPAEPLLLHHAGCAGVTGGSDQAAQPTSVLGGNALAQGPIAFAMPKGSMPAETKKGPLRFLMALPPYDAPHPTLELPFWVQKWSKLPAYLACCFGPRQHTVRQIAGRSKILLRRFPASRGQ